jgi:ABC-type uncharacterized transport system substrate-binding protein
MTSKLYYNPAKPSAFSTLKELKEDAKKANFERNQAKLIHG